MQSRFMNVYYGVDRLPYKDEKREVHYPNASGNIITGENNTTKIYFYVGLIGGSQRQWIANIKKPDGTLSYQLCTNGQSVGSDYRIELDIASLYADQVGDVYIGLQGYSGETVIVEDEGTYEISGNPIVLATGTIKIKVNYAPSVLPKGETLSPTTEQLILSALGGKLDITNGILVVDTLPEDTTDYQDEQVVFDKETSKLYELVDGEWNEFDLTNYEEIARIKSLVYVADDRFNLPTFENGKLVFFKNSGTLEQWNSTTSSYTVIANIPNFEERVSDLEDEVARIKTESYKVVDITIYTTLEDFLESDGEEGFMYLYPIDTTDLTKGYYRYVWENESWLALGTTEIDLTDYYTKTQVDSLFNTKASKVSVSSTGTSTDEINYITIDGVEKKIACSGGTGAVSSVNGKTGEVVLDGNDIRVNGSGSALMKDYLGQLREDTDGNTERIDDVEDDLDNVREVAEGKCKTYVISYNESALTEQYFLDGGVVYKTNGDIIDNWADFYDYVQGADIGNSYFNSQSSQLDITQEYIFTKEKIVILPNPTVESIKTGDIILVQETDVPDRWVNLGGQSVYYEKLETSKVDLTNYVDKTSAETISGVKTIADLTKLQFKDATRYIMSNNGLVFGSGGTDVLRITSGGLIPIYNNTNDIGSSSIKWKNLYLVGNLSDGTNSITIANIQAKGSVLTSAEATYSGAISSNNEYKFTTPLTSLTITQLLTTIGDTMPRWELNFVVGANFTISLPNTISWKYGTPTFEQNEEYTIYIKGNYAYLI